MTPPRRTTPPRRVVRLHACAEPSALRVLWVSSFDEPATQAFARDLAALRAERQPVCPVVVDSPGGDVYSLLAMMDLLSSYDGLIATVALGKAMSCGAALFTCGSPGHRYIAPNATLMLHDVSDETPGGRVADQRANVAETERVNDKMWARMARNIGQPPSYLLNLLKKRGGVDWYVTAREAVKLGLATHVGLPVFEVRRRLDPLLGVEADE